MAQVSSFFLLPALATILAAQTSSLPEAGLRAEGRGDWTGAIQVYRGVLATEPRRGDLWNRLADLQAKLGRFYEAASALAEAAQLAPKDPEAWARLSRAQAQAGAPKEALASIRRALALDPKNRSYRQAAGQLLSWNGEYAEAVKTYQSLREEDPSDKRVLRNLGQAQAWAGNTGAGARSLRAYLKAFPTDVAAWVELARMESWRGNYKAALHALDAQRTAGSSKEGDALRARLLAASGRPRWALAQPPQPSIVDSNFARAWAQISQGQARKADAAVQEMKRLNPGASETRYAEDALRNLTRGSFRLDYTVAQDSDDLETRRADASFSLPLHPAFRILGGYHRDDLKAKAGTGLERLDGRLDGDQSEAWLGFGFNFGAGATLDLRGGKAKVNNGEGISTYGGSLSLRPFDELNLKLSRDKGLYAISPRALDYLVTRTSSHLDATFASAGVTVDLNASDEDFSDGNGRKGFAFAPRGAVLRNSSFNLDLGLRGDWFAFEQKKLGHGYYDPLSYRRVALTAYGYFKLGDYSGIGFNAAYGLQRDETMDKNRYGLDGAVEGSFRLHPRWTLQLRVAFLENTRTATSAYRGQSFQAVLAHRF